MDLLVGPSNLELQELEASLAQQEAQTNQTRARLAQLRQSQFQSQPQPQPQPQSTPLSHQQEPPLLNTTYQSSPSDPPAFDAHPAYARRVSIPSATVGQPTLYAHGSYGTPMKRVRTCQPGAQHPVSGPAPNMARSKSSYATTNPFTSERGLVRSMPVSRGQMSTDRLPTEAETHQPPSPNLFVNSMDNYMSFPAQSYGVPLESVMEHGHTMGTMEDPSAFLQRFQAGIDIPRHNHSTVPIYGQRPAQGPYSSLSPLEIASSQCGSLSSGPTLSDTAMTRSSSNANHSAIGVHFSPQSTIDDYVSSPEYGSSPDQHMSPSKKRSAPDDGLLGMDSSPPLVPFANYASAPMGRSTSIDSRISSGRSQHMPRSAVNMHRHASVQSQPMQKSDSQLSRRSFNGTSQAVFTRRSEPMARTVSASSDKSVGSQDAAAEHSQPMERTDSARSAKSTQSQHERSKEALKRHNNHASIQPLAPKPRVESSSAVAAQVETKASAEGKLAMPRNSGYQRPKRPKIMCDQCDEHMDGFRGEHELRRHKDRMHSKEKKAFVCRRPVELNLSSDLQPVTPLEKCKHCKSGKEYGQYYNAAAHLRRAHFKEKPPRATRSKNGNIAANEEPRQKRAGMGGGDWPPMSELKAKWMEEIISKKQVNDTATISGDDDEDAELGMDIYEEEASIYLSAPMGYDAMAFVGSNTNLQVQNSEVYTDHFSNDLNYTISAYDPGMMPSTGSANFDFNAHGLDHSFYHPHALATDLSLSNQLQSPNNSTSTATLTATAFHHLQTHEQTSSQPIMNQLPPRALLDDMNFALATGGENDEVYLHQD